LGLGLEKTTQFKLKKNAKIVKIVEKATKNKLKTSLCRLNDTKIPKKVSFHIGLRKA
jgi:hypothetical protein